MPLPTSYTEKTLAEFMHTNLGKVAEILQLHFSPDGPGDYQEAVNDSLLMYGSEDLTQVTGLDSLKKLRALALVAAWRMVVNNFTAYYNHSADGASYDRGQLFKNAESSLKMAETRAAAYDTTASGFVVRVSRRQDPYQYLPDEENAE